MMLYRVSQNAAKYNFIAMPLLALHEAKLPGFKNARPSFQVQILSQSDSQFTH